MKSKSHKTPSCFHTYSISTKILNVNSNRKTLTQCHPDRQHMEEVEDGREEGYRYSRKTGMKDDESDN